MTCNQYLEVYLRETDFEGVELRELVEEAFTAGWQAAMLEIRGGEEDDD